MEQNKDNLFDSLAKGVADAFVVGETKGEGLWVWQDLPREFVYNKTLFETGRINEAKAGYDKLLGIPQTKDNGDLYWVILFDRGRIAEKEGNRAQAVDLYRKAVDVIEGQRATINTEASKIGFVGDKQAVYQHLVAALLAEGQNAVAFEYVERAKSRALVDMLAAKQDFAIHTVNAQQVRTLLAQVNTTESGGAHPGWRCRHCRQAQPRGQTQARFTDAGTRTFLARQRDLCKRQGHSGQAPGRRSAG